MIVGPRSGDGFGSRRRQMLPNFGHDIGVELVDYLWGMSMMDLG